MRPGCLQGRVIFLRIIIRVIAWWQCSEQVTRHLQRRKREDNTQLAYSRRFPFGSIAWPVAVLLCILYSQCPMWGLWQLGDTHLLWDCSEVKGLCEDLTLTTGARPDRVWTRIHAISKLSRYRVIQPGKSINYIQGLALRLQGLRLWTHPCSFRWQLYDYGTIANHECQLHLIMIET